MPTALRSGAAVGYFAYLRVADADSDYQRVKASGADVLSDIGDKPWGMREFSVRSTGGHRITIGHSRKA